MGPHIEHAAVVTFVLLGQFIGHFALRWANGSWHFLPETSRWLITLGIAAGLVAYFAILWMMIGLILLAGRLGLVDLEVNNLEHPGKR